MELPHGASEAEAQLALSLHAEAQRAQHVSTDVSGAQPPATDAAVELAVGVSMTEEELEFEMSEGRVVQADAQHAQQLSGLQAALDDSQHLRYAVTPDLRCTSVCREGALGPGEGPSQPPLGAVDELHPWACISHTGLASASPHLKFSSLNLRGALHTQTHCPREVARYCPEAGVPCPVTPCSALSPCC